MNRYLSIATIFLGSFLVFGVQPMVGRTILPVFGGTASVWVVCLCAFQVLLLAGYFYAHWLGGGERSRRSAFDLHPWLLIASAFLTAAVALKRGSVLGLFSTGVPSVDVLFCVVLLVGFSYVLLSANSSLIQVLAAAPSNPSNPSNPYRLYAVSNFGSLLGLIAYPFVFEPYVAISHQWLMFAAATVVYALLLRRLVGATFGVGGGKSSKQKESVAIAHSCSDSFLSTSLYLILPAASCFLLNALTTFVTLDIMPFPLIWTVSLALFLSSYIIGFSGLAGKVVKFAAVLSLALIVVIALSHSRFMPRVEFYMLVSVYGALLFVACTFLHSWLYLIRPHEAELTRYYLLQSVGGAVGGSLASLAFPMLARTVVEHPASLVLVGLLAVAFSLRSRLRLFPACLALAVAALVIAVFGERPQERQIIHRARGFFGTVTVRESAAKSAAGEGRIREYIHGSTIHGIQIQIPGKERAPTAYYTPNACGYAITAHPKYRNGEPMRVNLVGMGVGVLFGYARTNDYYRAYEISRDALEVALNTNLFTFVSDCPAKKDILLQDARKGLEAELAAGVEPYDVIVVDAFTGDNIPYHLSTVEAFELYFKLLKPDGVLAVNISNWHLQLEPFMKALGERFDCPLLGMATQNDFSRLQFAAKTAVFCRKPEKLAPPPSGDRPDQAWLMNFSKFRSMSPLPTDEKGSFHQLIQWN